MHAMISSDPVIFDMIRGWKPSESISIRNSKSAIR